MQYLTDRKRAQGLGAGGAGTHHHWQMMISSILLVPLVPLFIFTFGAGIGGSHAEVVAYFARPFPAIVTGISMTVILWHVMQEALVAVEDYVPGVKGKLALIAIKAFAYTMIVSGLFALSKLAL